MKPATLWPRFLAAIRRLRNRSAKAESDLAGEIQSFIEHEIAAKTAGGMNSEEARRQTLREFGGVEQVKEQTRHGRSGAWIESIGQDFAYGLRSLRHTPAFTIPLIASLSVGIAVTVAGFAFINAMLFRPYPGIEQPSEIVLFRGPSVGCRSNCWHGARWEDFGDMAAGFTDLQSISVSVATPVVVRLGEAKPVNASFVAATYFTTLSVRAAAGRLYSPSTASFENEGAVLGFRFWKNAFGGDPSVIGRSIGVGDRSVPIIGIAQESFNGLSVGWGDDDTTALWLPMPLLDALVEKPGNQSYSTPSMYYSWFGRRNPGVSTDEVRAQAQSVFASLAAAHGKVSPKGSFDVVGAELFGASTRRAVFAAILIIPPLLVLLIACSNAANLILARAARHRRELAIRLAIGASRGRIVRQMFIEGLLLAFTAACIALPFGSWGLRLASAESGFPMPVDPRVAAATLLTAFVCAIGFSLAPAFQITSEHPRNLLGVYSATAKAPVQMGARRRLIVIQVVLSLTLLIVGLETISILKSRRDSAGVQSDGLYLTYFDLGYLKRPALENEAFYNALLDRVVKLPQVAIAGVGPSFWRFPLNTTRIVKVNGLTFWLNGADLKDGKRRALGGELSRDTFRAVGYATTEGRAFEDSDYAATPPAVAVVNRAFSAKFLNGHGTGKILRVAPGLDGDNSSSVEVRVAGVINDAPGAPPVDDVFFGRQPAIFLPAHFDSEAARLLYIRTRNGTTGIGTAISKIVHDIDPQVSVTEAGTLDDFNGRSMPELLSWLTGGAVFLGFIALLLSTGGLYGMASYSVATRTKEIAIRMTVGASSKVMVRMFLVESMTLAGIGLAIGLPVAYAITRAYLIHNEPWTGIDHIDPAIFTRSTLEVTAALLLASLIPAVRASRVDPLENLKDE